VRDYVGRVGPGATNLVLARLAVHLRRGRETAGLPILGRHGEVTHLAIDHTLQEPEWVWVGNWVVAACPVNHIQDCLGSDILGLDAARRGAALFQGETAPSQVY